MTVRPKNVIRMTSQFEAFLIQLTKSPSLTPSLFRGGMTLLRWCWLASRRRSRRSRCCAKCRVP